MSELGICPAYGRDYETACQVQVDWEGGKDFRVLGGPYLSIRDTQYLVDRGHTAVVVVYDQASQRLRIPLTV